MKAISDHGLEIILVYKVMKASTLASEVVEKTEDILAAATEKIGPEAGSSLDP